MKSTINTFKDGIDKAFTTQPNVKLNSNTMMDAQKYKSSFVEEIDSDGNEYETFLEKIRSQKIRLKTNLVKILLRIEIILDSRKVLNTKTKMVRYVVLEHLMRYITTHLLIKKNIVE
jgi:hypothetical protein